MESFGRISRILEEEWKERCYSIYTYLDGLDLSILIKSNRLGKNLENKFGDSSKIIITLQKYLLTLSSIQSYPIMLIWFGWLRLITNSSKVKIMYRCVVTHQKK